MRLIRAISFLKLSKSCEGQQVSCPALVCSLTLPLSSDIHLLKIPSLQWENGYT